MTETTETTLGTGSGDHPETGPETTETTAPETTSETGLSTTGPVRNQLREITGRDRQVLTYVGVGTGLLGALGFLNSFDRVQAAAGPSFGKLAWTVPSGIDLGIVVFSALDIILARLDMRPRWLRWVPRILTAATIWLNVIGEFGRVDKAGHGVPVDWFAVVAHVVLPGLWIVATAVGAHTIRVRVGLESVTRMDRIRRSRWLLALPSTAFLWRRMVLWEERSYPAALRLERRRVLTLAELQETYGRFAWRWKAPRQVRALYRLGELMPARMYVRVPVPETTGRETAQPETTVELMVSETTETTDAPETETASETTESAPGRDQSRTETTPETRPETARETTAETGVVSMGDRSEGTALAWLRDHYRDQPVPGLNKACTALREAGLGMRRETVRDQLLTVLAAERETTTPAGDDLSDRAAP